ncbi:hypothetical protein [Leptospira adleri]|uniref:Uncharacterized protein n=1 Tax=Leptospira adleri TaxID=2023186 RepID=A0A2M9YJA9_9LEPT|nr:hypothetical protein [Leptospira adleri]PJZ51586.1 hypothetical protein CH380_19260 [Leptospira adleri]PJZ61905.1 hypothetical protein CH376_10905 [Leptospira adleri]
MIGILLIMFFFWLLGSGAYGILEIVIMLSIGIVPGRSHTLILTGIFSATFVMIAFIYVAFVCSLGEEWGMCRILEF